MTKENAKRLLAHFRTLKTQDAKDQVKVILEKYPDIEAVEEVKGGKKSKG